MALFDLFKSKKPNLGTNEGISQDEEVIQLPKLIATPITLTVEMQMRKREEELCKKYGISIPRQTETLD